MAYSFQRSASAQRMQFILDSLQAQHMTRLELQCLLGVSDMTALAYIRHLSREPKQIFICGWRAGMGPAAAVYAAGDLPDAPKPPAVSQQEYSATKWKRIKSDPDTHGRFKASQRLRCKVRRLRGKPQPWFAALLFQARTK